jgi:peptide/nickel transport system substrate-binding protein
MQTRRLTRKHHPTTYALVTVAVVAFLWPSTTAAQGESVGHSEAASNSPVGSDTLRINYWVEPARVSHIGPASHLVFEPMFRGSYTAPGEVSPALVTGWEPSDDYRTWTYYIRSDVRWHDGAPFTALDVKFSEDLRQHPTVGEPGTRRVRVVNDTTVEITYLRPMNPTPWRDVWPKHLLEHLDPEEFWEWDFWAQPVGSGPYRYVRHEDGKVLELEANPDYHAGAPAIENVIIRYDEDWEVLDSVRGNVDGFGAPAFPTRDFLDNSPDYRVYAWDQPVTGTALCWNHLRPIFRDPSVRRALTMAIDRRELARLRGYPEGAYARDVFAPQYPSGFDRGEPAPFDPDEARRLLTQAGWVEGARDGTRVRDGEELSFTLVVSEEAQEMEAARRVRRYLADVGVKVDIESAPSARAAGQRFWGGEVDAAMFRVSLEAIARAFESGSPVGFDDPDLIRHWEAANAVWNPEERRHHLNKVMTRFRELLPVTVLLPDVQFSVAHRRVKGLRSPDRGDLVEFLGQLWIEEDWRDSGGPSSTEGKR